LYGVENEAQNQLRKWVGVYPEPDAKRLLAEMVWVMLHVSVLILNQSPESQRKASEAPM